MKTFHVLVMTVLLTGLVECFSGDGEVLKATAPAPHDPAIVSKLRELIAIREQQVQWQQDLAKAGRKSGEPVAAVALAEARIELARELGQRDVVLAELKKIVEVRRDWLKHVENRVVDRLRQEELDEARAALLKAEVQLLREQKRRA